MGHGELAGQGSAVRAGPLRSVAGRSEYHQKGRFRFCLRKQKFANDIADKNTVVGQRLKKFVARMNADLDTNKQRPGVRPPGRVDEPQPLLLK